MNIGIRNHSKAFADDAPDGWVVFCLIYTVLSVIFTITGFICLFVVPGVYNWFFMASIIPTIWGALMVMGHDNSYFDSSEKSKLCSYYRSLPSELRTKVGFLTDKQINAMAKADVTELHNKLKSLSKAYWENQRALTSPYVTGILHNVEDATQALNNHTASLLEPHDNLKELA